MSKRDIPVWASGARAATMRSHASLFKALMVPDEEFARRNLHAELREAIALLTENGYVVSWPLDRNKNA